MGRRRRGERRTWKPTLEEPMDDIASSQSGDGAAPLPPLAELFLSFQASGAPLLWFYLLPVGASSLGSESPCRVRLGLSGSRRFRPTRS
jgi:hypothetical protein